MSLKNKVQREKEKRKRYLYNPYSDMIKLFTGLGIYLWYRPKVYFVSKRARTPVKGGVLIASNHTSTHDPVILFNVFWYRRLSFLATKELFEKKINNFFFKNMNCILVDRENFNISSVRSICERLQSDRAVVIFPEGAINRGEELQGFKDGTAFMARKSGKPVLPVYIAKRESFWDRTYVVVGEPVDVVEICKQYPRKEGMEYASRHLRDCELELEDYYRERVKQRARRLRRAKKKPTPEKKNEKIKPVVVVSRIPEDMELMPVYPDERYEEIMSCKNERVRQEKYFAWELLRGAVETYCGLPFESLDIRKNENGKWVSDKCFFSISHSDGIAAVALSSESIGIDVESVRRHREGIEKMILTPREREAAEALTDEARQVYIIKKWSQKESIFKTLDKPRFYPLSIETEEYNVATEMRRIDGRLFALSVCSSGSLDCVEIKYDL